MSGTRLAIAPVDEQSGPILLGDELRDFGAVAARMQVEALGGAVSVEAGSLRVELPAT